MKIGILHLTDLHIKSEKNFAIDRLNKLISAIRIDFNNLKYIYVVISGDIIDKGIIKNYPIVSVFLDNLKTQLNETVNIDNVKFIITPGNHDCDFKEENQLRRVIIQSLNYNTIKEDNSVIDLCVSIQESFWNFYERYNKIPNNKLLYQVIDEIEENTICFNCLNTSWMSQKSEKSDMFFPIKKLENNITLKKGTINISVFHHPVSWFTSSGETNNRKEIQQFLEDNSSIILSGHEHESEHKISSDLWSNKETLYFSGHIFQGQSPNTSGYQTVTIDIETKKGLLKVYNWQEDIYSERNSKNIALNGDKYSHKRFKHNSEYLSALDTLKIPVSAENREEIKLSELFVFPDLESPETKIKDVDSYTYYDSEKLITDNNIQTCLIEGENQSGKTSLISMLYKKFVDADKYPITIDCIRLKNANNIDNYIKDEFNNQYLSENSLDYERFKQEDRSKKIILLDNIHLLKFNSKTIKSIIDILENIFGKIIITTNPLYGLVSKIKSESNNLSVFNIKQLGYKKRNKLIENYHKLSLSPHTETDELLLFKTKESFHKVENVLGDELMPSYPVFIISILQTLVYTKTTSLEQTSYGYCYQTLIHIALANKAKVKNEYIDTYFNFLSEFALHLYDNEKDIFDVKDLEDFFNEYIKTYHVGFPFEKLKRNLLSSHLINIQDDLWQFSYEYIYYFLIARKIAEQIGTEEGKSKVKYLCTNIHQEKNAKILVFIAHHTKDNFLIEEATFTAMMPFENIAPITLNKDDHYYDLIKDIVKEISSDVIDISSNPKEYRDEILDSKDNMKILKKKEKEDLRREIEDDKGLNQYMLPFFQSFRAIEIVGQIIKNRKGSIPSDQLVDMIIELYNTAFRTISFFGKSLLDSKQSIIDSVSSKVTENDSNQEIKNKVNSYIQFFSLQICLGIFGKIIYSVGHNDLSVLFEKASRKIDTPASDLVTFSINSYYGTMSTRNLQNIVKKYEKNHVAMEIIKARVKSYLYQNFVDYRKKQSFASTLRVDIKSTKK